MNYKTITNICIQGLTVLALLGAPLSGAYGEGHQARSDLNVCRNTQIISYTPQSGSEVSSLEYIQYIVSEQTAVASLEFYINNQSYPVQYRELDDGTYRARVAVPEDLEGPLYVEMGAGSMHLEACNDLLTMSFVLDRDNSYSPHGVRTTSPSLVDFSPPREPRMTQIPESQAPAETRVVDDEEVVASEEPLKESLLSTVAEGASQASTQASNIFGSLSSLASDDNQTCSELGASWPWYLWLVFVVIYALILGGVLAYTIDPILGHKHYGRKLGVTITGATLLALIFWWLANPCYTHLWVPPVLALFSLVLYWLYSEEEQSPPDFQAPGKK